MERANKFIKGFFGTLLIFYATSFAAAAPSKSKVSIGGKPGQMAPQFSLKDLAGNTFSLESMRGKVVFLNIWATWCKPCAVEIPSMGELYKEIQGLPVVMVTLSIDKEGKPVIDKYFKNVFDGKVPPFPVLLDSDARISKLYGTFKVPETYIIDKDGLVRDKVEGIFDWNSSIVKNYLKLLAAEKSIP